jgi:hypothetical protein
MATKIWAAAEVELMSPRERHQIFENSLVWDLDSGPTDLIRRAIEEAERHASGEQ